MAHAPEHQLARPLLRPLSVLVATALTASLVATTALSAAAEDYHGCITPEMALVGVGTGDAPADHCGSDETLIEWNAEGPAGPEGPKGPKGDQGPAGADGAKGPKGPAGADGAKGPKGAAGADGADGEMGAVGETGPQGETGSAGEAGPAGETGPAGPAGADGSDGEPGPQGETGSPGANGADGEMGANGEQGPQGETGPAGPAGADGSDGEPGPQGPPGETGAVGAEGPPPELGEVVRLGQENVTLARTIVRAAIGTALWGIGEGPKGSAGVAGFSSQGVGLHGGSDSGYGLRVASGRIKVNQVSGVAVIPKGKGRVFVEPGVDVNDDTLVLVTPFANLGARAVWVTRSNRKNRFTIHISSPAGSRTGFSWLMIEKG